MPTGVFIRTKEHRANQSKAMKGKHWKVSDTSKNYMRGRVNKTSFKKGHIPVTKGKTGLPHKLPREVRKCKNSNCYKEFECKIKDIQKFCSSKCSSAIRKGIFLPKASCIICCCI